MAEIVVKKYILRVMSPIYVGYSDVYEPFNFVVDPDSSHMYYIDIEKFLLYLTDKDRQTIFEISKDTSSYSLVKFYRFMNSKLDYVKSHPKIILRKIKICSGFYNHYKKILNLSPSDTKQINQFLITMLSYNVNLNQPIIPGSSIKGSIRTAILNYYSNQVPRNIDDDRFLQKKILGYKYVNEDPLKYLKVSEFLPKKVNTKIVYAVNLKKDGSNTSTPYQISEVIETGSEFEGTISVINVNNIAKKFSHGIVEKALRDFYTSILQEEEKIYNKLSTKIPVCYRGIPLKIGRHSGAEAMTVEGFRKIRIKKGRKASYIANKTTTMWFASEKRKNFLLNSLEPFAWAEIWDQEVKKEGSSKKKTGLKKDKSKVSAKKQTLDLSALSGKYRIRRK